MVNVSIARRYARALLEAAGASTDSVLKQLDGFARVLAESPELTDVVNNPAYPRAEKTAVLEAVMQQLGVTEPTLVNVLLLLNERSRLGYVPDIARLYRDQADLKAGRVRGKVVSAVALGDEALQRLERSLEAATQRDVVLEASVDPKVLGGISAQIGSTLFDGTLRTQLDDLQRNLRS